MVQGSNPCAGTIKNSSTLTLEVILNRSAIGLALLLISACAQPGSMATVNYKIATASVNSDAIDLARSDGTLGGQTNPDGTACFWLAAGRDRIALSWPYGYTARISPLTVYDATGKPLAEVGEIVTLAGGLTPDDVQSITGCTGFTKFWSVGEVVSAQ
jgi:hypothetical protein